jgi:hypothetical protein
MDPQELIRLRQASMQRLPISVFITEIIAKSKELIVNTMRSGKSFGVMRVANPNALKIPIGFDIDANVPEVKQFSEYLQAAGGIDLHEWYFLQFSARRNEEERGRKCCIELQYDLQTNKLYVRSSRVFCSSDAAIFGKYSKKNADDLWSRELRTPSLFYYVSSDDPAWKKFDKTENIKYNGKYITSDESEFKDKFTE